LFDLILTRTLRDGQRCRPATYTNARIVWLVMPGLVPGIHVLLHVIKKDVEAVLWNWLTRWPAQVTLCLPSNDSLTF
jgi:hypothetical protein